MLLSLLLLFIMAALSSAGLVWLFMSVPQLMGFVESVTEWCRSTMLLCLPYVSAAKALVLWSGMALLGAGLVLALWGGLTRLVRGERALRRLPVKDRGLAVALIKDDNTSLAFTRGLINPKVYVTTGLLKNLTRRELMAVVLHEVHHRNRRDPLVFFLLSILRDLFFYLPIAGYMVRKFMYRRELEADDAALKGKNDGLHLASALLKLARTPAPVEAGLLPQPVSIRGRGALEQRIKRLVGEGGFSYRPHAREYVSSTIAAVVLTLSLTVSLFASARPFGDCDLGHCSGHVEEIGRDCMVHCDNNRMIEFDNSLKEKGDRVLFV